MSTHRHRILLCPVCHARLSASSNADGSNSAPQEGDLTVCLYCGSVLEFGSKLALRTLSTDDYARLDDETRTALQNAIAETRTARLSQVVRH